jgi:predicted nucleic acid-binding protein
VIVLDTNVLSETLKGSMNPGVARWFDEQSASALFMTCVSQAELWVGVRLLAQGKRHSTLEAAVAGMFGDFDGRMLAFDGAAADHYADILVSRRAAGRPISQFDCQIAGITRSRGARLATRNVADFEGIGIELINPFD